MMISTLTFCAGAILCPPGAMLQSDPGLGELLEAELIFEMNATDDDAEVVLELNAEAGMDRVVLYHPSGKPILRLASSDGEDLGLSEVLLETAEPDVTTVMLAYPEGTYRLVARFADRRGWASIQVELSHDLASQPSILSPAAGGSVPASGAVVTWQADPDVEAWIVEVEHDELGLGMTVELPGEATSLALPDGFLVSGEEFELGLHAVNEPGNVIVTETTFNVL
jgi:hypothetical protein